MVHLRNERAVPWRGRFLSQVASGNDKIDVHGIPHSIPYWLYTTSALIFVIVVVGGLTRLTESGLSITEWKPITGSIPPLSAEQWHAEFERYKASPEFKSMNTRMTMDEFKTIFWWEWSHRQLGRTIGLVFAVPAAYYLFRYKLPPSLRNKMLAMTGLIASQGALGWYMVKSGLQVDITQGEVARVSQYRLAAHLSTALALFVLTLHTASGIVRDRVVASSYSDVERRRLLDTLNHANVRRFKGGLRLLTGIVALTIVSGERALIDCSNYFLLMTQNFAL